MANQRDDIDLMQQFDGELPGEPAALSEQDQLKLQALEQVGDAVRTHLELAADEVESKLDSMWGTIERRIAANGEASEAAVETEAVAAPARARPVAEPPHEGFFTRAGQWLDRYRSQVLTGAVCAGAAAALVIVLRPPQTVTRTQFVEVPVETKALTQKFASSPAVVEDLDVVDGSGAVLTIPGEEGENSTTVIWVTRDDMEGPI